jgi:hypothetical protein
MNKSKPLKALVQKMFATVTATVLICGLASILYAAEPLSGTSPQQTDSATVQTNIAVLKAKTPDTDTSQVVVKRQITGAELYSMNCNRCHQERYPTERTGAQWKTIMLHMQVRANIPVSQAKLILQYLQENSGR